MKKELEELLFTVEHMGYAIIDPVLAHWQPNGQAENRSDPMLCRQNSPVLFDDIWLEEYLAHLQ